MKFVIQRVDKASVTVENKIVGEIGKGFLVLVGVCDTDTREIADKMLGKMLRLRIFADENDKTNLDLNSVNLHYMPTAARETVHPSPKPEIRSLPMRCMNIF